MAKMFRKGVKIYSVTGLVKELEAKNYVFYKGRPLHHDFIRNMTLNTVLGGVRAGLLHYAVRKTVKINQGEWCPFLSCLKDVPHEHKICPMCGAVRYGNTYCSECRSHWDDEKFMADA